MITNSKQSWEVGEQVRVGFLSCLTVIAAVPTPGDFAPDAYVLARGEQFYSFVPHDGITKITNGEAREMVERAAAAKRAAKAKSEAQTAKILQAASLRAELMALVA